MNNKFNSLTKLIIVSIIVLFPFSAKAQVGINNNEPPSSAVLDLVSSGKNQGLLVPRVEILFTEGPDHNPPANGLLVFCTTDNTFYFYHDGWYAVNSLEQPDGSSDITAKSGDNIVVTNGNINVTTGNITASSGTVTANKFVGNGTIPVGGIIMWTGTTVPDNSWVLCMGGSINDTESPINGHSIPDLRGRFIVGYDDRTSGYPAHSGTEYHTIGNTGGEKEVTLTTGNLPQHNHEAKGSGATISISASGGHKHTVKGQYGGDNGDHTNITTLGAGDKGETEISFNFDHTSSSDEHTHANSFFNGVVGNGAAQGLNSTPHPNRPPYYVLAFIMRIK